MERDDRPENTEIQLDRPLNAPWLLAAWSGMGAVGQLALQYLAHALDARPVGTLLSDPWFGRRGVSVLNGVAHLEAPPGTRWLLWRDPREQHDLLLLPGEAQPASDQESYCGHVLDVALEQGVERVLTFAAMAGAMHPASSPRVFGAASEIELSQELTRAGVEPLARGEIGGLNGLLVGVAAERGVRAACLLGEFPYFAGNVPNPKSSAAVLRTLARLANLEIDLETLDQRGAEVERRLVELLKELQEAQGAEAPPTEAPWQQAEETEEEPGPSPEARRRIENLFEQAAKDRSKAVALKGELDRHGVFEEYEDRFLDLFKQAE